MADLETLQTDAEVVSVAAPSLTVEEVEQPAPTLVDVGYTTAVEPIAAPAPSLTTITTTQTVDEVAQLSLVPDALGASGPQGPPGPPGPAGDGSHDDLPDLTLIFENGLI